MMDATEDFYTDEIADSPNTSSDILKKILERGNDDWVSRYAAMNLNCPHEALTMVLERGIENDVSWYAAKNPNCPPEALIKWMQKIGKIKRFDPIKHKE